MSNYIVWNGDKSIGIVTKDRQLAYELRKGALNPLGIITSTFCEAWAEMTASENCTIENVPGDLVLLDKVLGFLSTKNSFWLTTDGNDLVVSIGHYLKEKGETWRIGEGCEIIDKYQALLKRE